jgi:hypothetical protein
MDTLVRSSNNISKNFETEIRRDERRRLSQGVRIVNRGTVERICSWMRENARMGNTPNYFRWVVLEAHISIFTFVFVFGVFLYIFVAEGVARGAHKTLQNSYVQPARSFFSRFSVGVSGMAKKIFSR